jgi:error-prone DNA polymerase
VFAAALLNAQPMGFYAPAQIVRDVREHGVEVRAVDVNFSDYDAVLEPGPAAAERLHELHDTMRDDIRTTHAVRLGMREIKGLSEDHARLIAERRGAGYASMRDLWLRTGLPPRVLERLADADAFGSLGLSRRQALWTAKALGRSGDQDDLPLLRSPIPPLQGEGRNAEGVPGWGQPPPPQPSPASGGGSLAGEPAVALPPMLLGEEVVNDYRFLQMTLRAHPAAFLRADLEQRGIARNETLRRKNNGARVRVSGLVTIRQRPGSAEGVVFMTIEDESAIANIVVWPNLFERFRPIILGARYVAVTGRMQHESGVIHVVADRLDDLTPLLARLADDGASVESLARGHEVKHPVNELRAQNGGRDSLLSPLTEMPELASDLDVPARGSAHAPSRHGGSTLARKT